jgi:hypothetical protein
VRDPGHEHKLGAKLGIDPTELLRMINRKVTPNNSDRGRISEGVGLRSGHPAQTCR